MPKNPVLTDRQKEILGLLNQNFSLGIEEGEISTFENVAKIISVYRTSRMKLEELHSLGIPKRSLLEIAEFVEEKPVERDPYYDGHGNNFFPFGYSLGCLEEV